MANKKVKPTEDYESFLPIEVQESKKLDQTEKNVLAAFCYFRLNYSIHAKQHDGWYYCDLARLAEESDLSVAQLKRVILKLVFKRLIERKSGTNHKCTHYRLHHKIDELLPDSPEEEIDDSELEKMANEPLDKIRLDEYSEDESSLIKENDVSHAPLKEGAAQHKLTIDEILERWKIGIEKAATVTELKAAKKLCSDSIVPGTVPLEYKPIVDDLNDRSELRYAILKSKGKM